MGHGLLVDPLDVADLLVIGSDPVPDQTVRSRKSIEDVDLNGKLEVQAIRILPEAVDPNEITMLQDLIRAAFTDASEKVREAMQGEMGGMFPGMNPGMFS